MDEKYKGFCDRCCRPTNITIMSKFNKDIICMPCKEEEKMHPEYKKASDAELDAVKRGDYNFDGIGLPDDISKRYSNAENL